MYNEPVAGGSRVTQNKLLALIYHNINPYNDTGHWRVKQKLARKDTDQLPLLMIAKHVILLGSNSCCKSTLTTKYYGHMRKLVR